MKLLVLMTLLALTQLPSATLGELPCGLGNQDKSSLMSSTGRSVQALPGEATFAARLVLVDKPGHLCNAVIIWSYILLTATKCVSGMAPNRLKVVYGDYDLANNNDGNLEVNVSEVRQAKDVSFVITKRELEFKLPPSKFGSVNKICLPPRGSSYSGSLIYFGWDPQITTLASSVFEPVDVQHCLSRSLSVSKSDVCLKGETLSKFALGGGLVRTLDDGRLELVAVVTKLIGDGFIVGTRYTN